MTYFWDRLSWKHVTYYYFTVLIYYNFYSNIFSINVRLMLKTAITTMKADLKTTATLGEVTG